MPERFNFCILRRAPGPSRGDALGSLPFQAQGPGSVLIQDLRQKTWSESPWPAARPLLDGDLDENQLITIYFPLTSGDRLSITIERAGGTEAWVLSLPGRVIAERPEQAMVDVFNWSRAALGECILLGGHELELTLHPSEAQTLEGAFRSRLLEMAILDRAPDRPASAILKLPISGWRLFRFWQGASDE